MQQHCNLVVSNKVSILFVRFPGRPGWCTFNPPPHSMIVTKLGPCPAISPTPPNGCYYKQNPYCMCPAANCCPPILVCPSGTPLPPSCAGGNAPYSSCPAGYYCYRKDLTPDAGGECLPNGTTPKPTQQVGPFPQCLGSCPTIAPSHSPQQKKKPNNPQPTGVLIPSPVSNQNPLSNGNIQRLLEQLLNLLKKLLGLL